MTVAPASANETTERPAGDAAAAGSARGFLRRNRVGIYVAVALLLALVTAAWLGGGEDRDDALDPENPGPEGAQAVAQVLADEGVDVSIVRSAAALEDETISEDTTVVVTNTEELAPSTLDRLLDHVPAGRLVVVDPPPQVLAALEPDAGATYGDDQLPAGCPEYDGLEVEVDTTTTYLGLQGCFPSGGGHVVATADDGATYLGAGQALTNDQIQRADNAAVVLRLLGERERLVWYVPTFEDAAEDEAVDLWSLVPDWVGPALWVAALSAVGLMLWRFRRLGPLATEPLPVVVRAAETAHSRGRMYRRANDRGHAAAVLRTAARRRLADRLGLGRQAGEREVVAVAARRLGRTEHEVAAVLGSQAPVPGSDTELLRLANELDGLEREVGRG